MVANAPTKEGNLVSNPNYVETKYDPNLKDSKLWEDVGIWKGTVFGNVGDMVTKDYFSLGKDNDGNMNISVTKNKGKIASTADGIAMYYYKVPVGSNFTLTATAKINSLSLDNQVSFGLMARDDMYIDDYISAAIGDYVAAGPLRLKDATPWNCFARKSGVLTQGSKFTNTTFEVGSEIPLKIQSNSDGYACTIGNEEAITGGFDFALTKVDSKYVYVGMFVARNANVSFKDIKLVVDGKEVTDSNGVESEQPTKPEDSSTPENPQEPSKPEVPENPGDLVIPEVPKDNVISDLNSKLPEGIDSNTEEVLEDEVDDKTSLFALPSTGDKNISVYYLIGTILVAFVAGVIFYKKKTKRA